MTIFRTQHQKNYTIVNNHILTDKRLSWKAKGIWLYAFSRPDDWVFHLKDLMAHSTDGKESVNSGLKELENAGYLRKNNKNRTDQGRFSNAEWIFYETPTEISNNVSKPGNPLAVNSASEKQPLLNTDITNQNTSYSLLNEREVSKDTSSRSKQVAPRCKAVDICFSKEKFIFEGITSEDLSRWEVAYPGVNVKEQLAKMCDWILSNPRKGQKRNWRRFIASWLSKASDTLLSKDVRMAAKEGASIEESWARTNTSKFYELKEKYPQALSHCYVKNGYLINKENSKELSVKMEPDRFMAAFPNVAGVRMT